LFVVLGHEGCGAISAALATKHEVEQSRSRVQLLVASILPGLPATNLRDALERTAFAFSKKRLRDWRRRPARCGG
jgi:carbonic anhydrase